MLQGFQPKICPLRQKVCIFASSFRQDGKIEESAFSLYSAVGKLGHFTDIDAGNRENDCLLEVYSYIRTIPQVELIKFLICIIQRESKPDQQG